MEKRQTMLYLKLDSLALLKTLAQSLGFFSTRGDRGPSASQAVDRLAEMVRELGPDEMARRLEVTDV